jgi:hypothetical protein
MKRQSRMAHDMSWPTIKLVRYRHACPGARFSGSMKMMITKRTVYQTLHAACNCTKKLGEHRQDRQRSRLDVTHEKIHILLMAVQEKRVAGLAKRLASDNEALVCVSHDLTITNRASAATRPCADKNTVACESPDLNFAMLDVTNPAKASTKNQQITSVHIQFGPFKRGAAAAPTNLITRRSVSTYAISSQQRVPALSALFGK